jgi:hypothetical protein
MRAGYEKRVEQYQNGVVKEFRDVFLETFREFDKAQYITDEMEVKITELVNLWEESKSNYHRLDSLIQNRLYIFLGWMVVFSCSIAALYSQYQGKNLLGADWYLAANVLFIILLIATTAYFYGLMKFDWDLSKYSEKKSKEKIEFSEEKTNIVRISSIQDIERENKEIVDKFLENLKIKYEKETRIKNYRVDFAIPDSKSPEIAILVSVSRTKQIHSAFFYRSIVALFAILKKDFPQLKTVLITNFEIIKNSRIYEEIMKFTDRIFTIDKMEELEKFIKEKPNQ